MTPQGDGWPLSVVFHNLRVNRPRPLVGREVAAMLEDLEPDVAAVAEAWQYDGQLAAIPGWRYLARRGASPGERDAGWLVRRGVRVQRFGVVRCRTGWPRTKGPGMHWPRTLPWVDLERPRVRLVVMHWQRNQPANRLAIAEVWVRLLGLAIRTRRPLVLIGDTNQGKRRRAPFSPRQLARAMRGSLWGVGIMQAITRGVRVRRVRLVESQQRGSDHPPLALELWGRARGG